MILSRALGFVFGILLPIATLLGLAFVGLLVLGNAGWAPFVITREGEQKVILFLDRADRVTKPGISWRWPFVEREEIYSSRWLYLNSGTETMQTRDGETLTIDSYAIWRIGDAIAFKRSFPGGEDAAHDRLDRAVRDDVREVIGRHTLAEILTDRRTEIMAEITDRTRKTGDAEGIEVQDVRINRTELPEETMKEVYQRMRTERERLARKNRAEGEEAARNLRAKADYDAKVTLANARLEAELARGQGDARSTAIYAEAYGRYPEFYDFIRSLEAYQKTIGGNTTLVLSPKAEFFRFIESSNPDGTLGQGVVPAPPAPADAGPEEGAGEPDMASASPPDLAAGEPPGVAAEAPPEVAAEAPPDVAAEAAPGEAAEAAPGEAAGAAPDEAAGAAPDDAGAGSREVVSPEAQPGVATE